jgi:hypothetical protein
MQGKTAKVMLFSLIEVRLRELDHERRHQDTEGAHLMIFVHLIQTCSSINERNPPTGV